MRLQGGAWKGSVLPFRCLNLQKTLQLRDGNNFSGAQCAGRCAHPRSTCGHQESQPALQKRERDVHGMNSVNFWSAETQRTFRGWAPLTLMKGWDVHPQVFTDDALMDMYHTS